jgi:small-conductance mechanosensitive channel
MKINDAFKEAGIVIAFPQIDVHFDPKPKDSPDFEEPIPGSA